MIPLPLLTGLPWRLIGAVAGLVAIGVLVWRVTAWRDAYEALPSVRAELAAEVACAPASACARRAEEAAEQARAEAEERAVDAAEALRRAEEQARADAAAWRRKYQGAIASDPGCAAWAEMEIRCPIQ